MKVDDFSKEIAFGDDPEFDKWVGRNILNQFLFTHREKNGERFGYCSACRSLVSFTKRTFTADDIENEGKRHNQIGYCPQCGEKVIFKDSGRPRTNCLSYDRFITYEITDSGLIIRFIAAQLDYRAGNLKGIVPRYFEEYRLYLNPVKKVVKMWQRPIGYISYWDFQRYKIPTEPLIGQWFEMNKQTYRPKKYENPKIYKGAEFYSQLKKVKGFEYIR